MSEYTDLKETMTSPDSLLEDKDSQVFYVLRDESVALAKTRDELPYRQNRASYLACGRISPKHKMVLFWPDPVNPSRCFDVLLENNHIDGQYDYKVSGVSTKVGKKVKNESNSSIDRLDNVRQANIQNLLKGGMRVQTKNDQSKKNQ